MQHDARILASGDVTMFDDHDARRQRTGVARGIEYALDHTAHTASVVWQFLGTGQSEYEGSCRRYADGETVIGWGDVPTDARVLSEVDGNGTDVFDISLAGNASYRAVKVPLSQLDIGLLRANTAQ